MLRLDPSISAGRGTSTSAELSFSTLTTELHQHFPNLAQNSKLLISGLVVGAGTFLLERYALRALRIPQVHNSGFQDLFTQLSRSQIVQRGVLRLGINTLNSTLVNLLMGALNFNPGIEISKLATDLSLTQLFEKGFQPFQVLVPAPYRLISNIVLGALFFTQASAVRTFLFDTFKIERADFRDQLTVKHFRENLLFQGAAHCVGSALQVAVRSQLKTQPLIETPQESPQVSELPQASPIDLHPSAAGPFGILGFMARHSQNPETALEVPKLARDTPDSFGQELGYGLLLASQASRRPRKVLERLETMPEGVKMAREVNRGDHLKMAAGEENLFLDTEQLQRLFRSTLQKYLEVNSHPTNPAELQNITHRFAQVSMELRMPLELLSQSNPALALALCCRLGIIPEGSSIRNIPEIRDYFSEENSEALTEEQMDTLENRFDRSLTENLGELENHEALITLFREKLSHVPLPPLVLEYLSSTSVNPIAFFYLTHALGLHALRRSS